MTAPEGNLDIAVAKMATTGIKLSFALSLWTLKNNKSLSRKCFFKVYAAWKLQDAFMCLHSCYLSLCV